MKVLLINSPVRLDAKPNVIPYGLATIAAHLTKSGHEVEIYDVNALRSSRETILTVLARGAWDVIGVSGLVTTYRFQKWLIGEVKRLCPGSKVISGGGLATAHGKLMFDRTQVDIIVRGEGERTMLELCNNIEEVKAIWQVPGIWFRQDDRIVKTAPRKNINRLDDILFPAWDLLPMEIYLANPIWGDIAGNSSGFGKNVQVNRSMNIVSTRGCPFGCRYCYHLFGRSDYRFRSAENVVLEIQNLVADYRVDFIGLVDDNMMANEKRLLKFCDLMVQKKFPVTWGCHGRVTSANPRVLKRMADAGCVWIGYGIESGSQKMLDLMNKKAKVDQARQAIIKTREAGIFANTTFIYGYPGETRKTIQETVDFKRDLGIECGSFFATPYPGTPLYEEISHMIQDEEAFVFSLGNATDFCINLTDFPDDVFFDLKNKMDNNQDVV